MSMDEWIQMLYIYAMECYEPLKTEEVLPFATTWRELETIMLREISQKEE